VVGFFGASPPAASPPLQGHRAALAEAGLWHVMADLIPLQFLAVWGFKDDVLLPEAAGNRPAAHKRCRGRGVGF